MPVKPALKSVCSSECVFTFPVLSHFQRVSLVLRCNQLAFQRGDVFLMAFILYSLRLLHCEVAHKMRHIYSMMHYSCRMMRPCFVLITFSEVCSLACGNIMKVLPVFLRGERQSLWRQNLSICCWLSIIGSVCVVMVLSVSSSMQLPCRLRFPSVFKSSYCSSWLVYCAAYEW